MPRPQRPTAEVLKLRKAHDELSSRLLRAREELQIAERHRVGLEAMLDVRQERVDALTVQIGRLRAQNKKLDAECEHLAEIVRSEGRPL